MTLWWKPTAVFGFCILLIACSAPDAQISVSSRAADILIVGGTLITMDPQRRVLEDAAVAVTGDRIAEIGATEEMRAKYRAKKTIDAHRKVVMPGLIDGHAHAGHGLVKSLGTDLRRMVPGLRNHLCRRI